MTRIEIADRATLHVKTRAWPVPVIELAVAGPHNTDVAIQMSPDTAEMLSNQLMAAAVAINDRPPLDKSTALDAGAAAS